MAATAAAVPPDTGQPGLLTGTYAVGTVRDTDTQQSIVKYSALSRFITIIFEYRLHIKTKKTNIF
jgi:hypothetical protein